ncbi:MAG TPA: hypothetical protein VJ981_02420 [Gammaproteobacteria bacterium]|nr:hypothetical protein [Gammaproteobacteria bacterium]
MPHIFKRDMTITHADFFRLLPRALDKENYAVSGNMVKSTDGVISMRITLSPEQSWRIGALSLPKTQVVIEIEGCDEQEAQRRINRFDQSYQKGGG